MRARRLPLLALALASLHCGGSSPDPFDPVPPVPGVADADRDGFPATVDCDDRDFTVWQRMPLYRDQDRDGAGAGPLLDACVGNFPAPGWSSAGGDCDDLNAAAWQLVPAHADLDGDGVGGGPSLQVCAGSALPQGFVAGGGDCAPDDGLRWRELAFLFRDGDGDGATVAQAGTVCAGAALPAGYAAEPGLPDCDDANRTAFVTMPGYPDADGDGVGAGDPVSLCTGGALPAGYAPAGGDCAPGNPAAWQGLVYSFRDADGDGAWVFVPGSLCSGAVLPAGYAGYAAVYDCDDGDPAVHATVYGFADGDGDGVGIDPLQTLCTAGGLPSGYSLAPGDCEPDDPSRWQELAYSYRDADEDGFWTPASGALCAGAALPSGYGASATAFDCDDADPAVHATVHGFADGDLDGVGEGPAIASCTAGSLPAGHVAGGGDCAPGDGARWRNLAYAGVDRDRDGTTAREAGQLCAGAALPDPYRASTSGNDCDDADPLLYRWVVLYRDQDGDGIGAPPRSVQCLGPAIPAGWSTAGWDPNDADPAQRLAADLDDLLGL